MLYNDYIQNLIKLINCASVTPKDDGAMSVLINILKPLGFSVEKKVFQTEKTYAVNNLYARFGINKPHLMFAGHVDVVPPGILSKWKYPPFSATISDGRLYGRGAVDMKGNISCFIAAISRFISKCDNFGSISLLITGDEEGSAINGTKKMLSWADKKNQNWDACILGEPTCSNIIGDTIKIGRRGSLSGNIVINGKQGHVAYQHKANNPIKGLIPLLEQLKRVDFDSGNDYFPPTNLEITTIDVGNPVLNVIPAEVKISFNIRFNNIWNEQTLKEEVSKRLKKAIQGNDQYTSGLSYNLQFIDNSAQAFLTQNKKLSDLLAKSINNITGQNPQLSTNGGSSDARFIKDYCPVIEFGLVSKTIHEIDENVPIADLDILTCIYEDFLHKWFAANKQIKTS
ncbi:succinyl-diaminopimelate desuccinylase [Candidatus Liberibacter americanus]|uniref:Succinyl-diaminopimelate desuccinylase n=1 Tax=Candidatus Liberibacter americanus str. Sao Paulo TaxID=1261131 RepID=U6B729_9HYPH|nr:succinyl-diaminopimelate desuccinylase [Candidatus Liberibacter americanus]AHA27552.1 N-succinyl-L,L-diaminopimelate desuccinylase [Candidatus Liberibacter americanus str. Sao Paulo]EMS36487.1 succinyl-diaminopimelate desuccinylase [Candidatus Liberibacter americanus PW_SP]